MTYVRLRLGGSWVYLLCRIVNRIVVLVCFGLGCVGLGIVLVVLLIVVCCW